MTWNKGSQQLLAGIIHQTRASVFKDYMNHIFRFFNTGIVLLTNRSGRLQDWIYGFVRFLRSSLQAKDTRLGQISIGFVSACSARQRNVILTGSSALHQSIKGWTKTPVQQLRKCQPSVQLRTITFRDHTYCSVKPSSFMSAVLFTLHSLFLVLITIGFNPQVK